MKTNKKLSILTVALAASLSLNAYADNRNKLGFGDPTHFLKPLKISDADARTIYLDSKDIAVTTSTFYSFNVIDKTLNAVDSNFNRDIITYSRETAPQIKYVGSQFRGLGGLKVNQNGAVISYAKPLFETLSFDGATNLSLGVFKTKGNEQTIDGTDAVFAIKQSFHTPIYMDYAENFAPTSFFGNGGLAVNLSKGKVGQNAEFRYSLRSYGMQGQLGFNSYFFNEKLVVSPSLNFKYLYGNYGGISPNVKYYVAQVGGDVDFDYQVKDNLNVGLKLGAAYQKQKVKVEHFNTANDDTYWFRNFKSLHMNGSHIDANLYAVGKVKENIYLTAEVGLNNYFKSKIKNYNYSLGVKYTF